MRAMVLQHNAPITDHPLQLSDVEPPTPGAGDVRIRVHVCAICRTDLHVIEGDLPFPGRPLVPGHQIVGTVEALGADCKRFRVGDRVGVAWLHRTCGRCDDCRSDRENLCTASRYTGYDVDGGYAELAVAPEAFVYALPQRFDDLQVAPLLCAGIIGFRALARARLPRGGRLGLFGFGSSAHVVMQLAHHRGAEVFVATRGESHRRLAREMGAAWTGDTFDPIPVTVDSAIVFAPAGEVVPPALRALRKGGTVALAGIHMSAIPELEYEPHLFHEKTLTSVEANTRADGEALLCEAAEIPVRPRVTTFPLEAANEALVQLKQDQIDGTGVLLCRES